MRSRALGSPRRIRFWRLAAARRTYSLGPKNPAAKDATTIRILVLGLASNLAVAATATTSRITDRITFDPYNILSALGPRKPARISRRAITVESLGADGTRVPSFLTSSRQASEGWLMD